MSKDTPTPAALRARIRAVLRWLSPEEGETILGEATTRILALLPLDPGEAPAPTKEIMETMLLCIWEWRKNVHLAEEKERPVALAFFEGKIRGMEKAIKIVRAAAAAPAPAPKGEA